MNLSEAYADLGGGARQVSQMGHVRQTPSSRALPAGDTAAKNVHGREDTCRHHFDVVSGWCGCGVRDDGALAPGSPAWQTGHELRTPSAQPGDCGHAMTDSRSRELGYRPDEQVQS